MISKDSKSRSLAHAQFQTKVSDMSWKALSTSEICSEEFLVNPSVTTQCQTSKAHAASLAWSMRSSSPGFLAASSTPGPTQTRTQGQPDLSEALQNIWARTYTSTVGGLVEANRSFPGLNHAGTKILHHLMLDNMRYPPNILSKPVPDIRICFY